jgi:hypothetical protein
MTTHTITKRGKLALSFGTSALTLIFLFSPVGRSGIATSFQWVLETVDAVTEFPCRIVTNLRHISLDRLDPTCPQCM